MANQKIVLIDTNIVIEYFKQNNSILNVLEGIGYDKLAISAITVGEMYFGALNKLELYKIKNRIEKFIQYPVNENVTDLFINLLYDYSLAYKLSIPDALIAATSIVNDFELYTLNIKDFHFIKGIQLYKVRPAVF